MHLKFDRCFLVRAPRTPRTRRYGRLRILLAGPRRTAGTICKARIPLFLLRLILWGVAGMGALQQTPTDERFVLAEKLEEM